MKTNYKKELARIFKDKKMFFCFFPAGTFAGGDHGSGRKAFEERDGKDTGA